MADVAVRSRSGRQGLLVTLLISLRNGYAGRGCQ